MLLSKKQQNITIVVLSALIALSPFSIDMYLPAFPVIATSLKTDSAHIGYSLTSYFAGLCVGQLIYGILLGIWRAGADCPLTHCRCKVVIAGNQDTRLFCFTQNKQHMARICGDF